MNICLEKSSSVWCNIVFFYIKCKSLIISGEQFLLLYIYIYMVEQKQDDQHEHTFSSYVRIRDVALKAYQRQWTIRRSGERGSGISVLAARHDDIYIYIYIYMQISLNIIDILCLHIFFWIRSNSRITFIVFGGNWLIKCLLCLMKFALTKKCCLNIHISH